MKFFWSGANQKAEETRKCREYCKIIHNLAKNVKQPSLTSIVAHLNLPTEERGGLHHCLKQVIV